MQRSSSEISYVNSSGKQCICTYKLQKPPTSDLTEMDGFVLVGRFPNPSQTQKICGYTVVTANRKSIFLSLETVSFSK